MFGNANTPDDEKREPKRPWKVRQLCPTGVNELQHGEREVLASRSEHYLCPLWITERAVTVIREASQELQYRSVPAGPVTLLEFFFAFATHWPTEGLVRLRNTKNFRQQVSAKHTLREHTIFRQVQAHAQAGHQAVVNVCEHVIVSQPFSVIRDPHIRTSRDIQARWSILELESARSGNHRNRRAACLRKICKPWAMLRSSGTGWKLLRKSSCWTPIVLKKSALPFMWTCKAVSSQ